MKFILPIDWDKGWLDVEAELIDVAPHLASELTFAIYRNPEGSCRWGRWSIGNVESGQHIYSGWSRQKTIDGAIKKCADKTVWNARRGLRKALAGSPQLAREIASVHDHANN